MQAWHHLGPICYKIDESSVSLIFLGLKQLNDNDDNNEHDEGDDDDDDKESPLVRQLWLVAI